MATRMSQRQSEHDGAVRAAQLIYSAGGRYAWINPDGERNKHWAGRYIDVIAVAALDADEAWVVEIETTDSVTDTEASKQWVDYNNAYSHWYLAVPQESRARADELVTRYGLNHCKVVTWQRNADGTHTFWGLPGLN